MSEHTISSPKNYLVTSAQYGAKANKKFVDSLKRYSDKHGNELLVLPIRGKNIEEDTLDDLIAKENLVSSDVHLNRKIKVSNYNILPQQIDPVTGLDRFTQSDVSTIFASPKQRLRVTPNSNYKLPKILMTTGAITHPNYRDDRIGRIAERDHIHGAVTVSVLNDKKYHFRHIQADNEGAFVDLAKQYSGKGVAPMGIEALVLGDWHVGDTNPDVRNASFEMISTLNPKRIVLHDFFNGHSINPFEAKSLVSSAKRFSKGTYNLEQELKDCYDEITAIAKVAGKSDVVIVNSNHDRFLNGYLSDGGFVKEPHNLLMASKLLTKFIEGQNPLEEGMKMFGKLPRNVHFLKKDEDYKIRGWQLGNHGDLGANGARTFTMRGKEYAFGKSITGHRHSPEILRNTYVVGTSTHLRLPYMGGPSNWVNSHAVLYNNGTVQLVNVIDGKWK